MDELEELYEKYKDKDFIVLGFPSNQFNNQEPLNGAEAAEFCRLSYGVTFPIFDKIEVNGEQCGSALQIFGRTDRRRRHQVEFHKIPDRPRRRNHQTFCPDHHAKENDKTD